MSHRKLTINAEHSISTSGFLKLGYLKSLRTPFALRQQGLLVMRLWVPRIVMWRHGGHGPHVWHIWVRHGRVHIVHFWPLHFRLRTNWGRGRKHWRVVTVRYGIVQGSRLRVVMLWRRYFRCMLGRWRWWLSLLMRLWCHGSLTTKLARSWRSRTWVLFHNFLVLWSSVLKPYFDLQQKEKKTG